MWLLLLACALSALCVHAWGDAAPTLATPPGHYLFRSFGPSDGLANTAVTQLMQDTHGFIYAGTDDGVYRYDGYHFEMVGPEQGLPIGGIDLLWTDPHGMLWVGSRNMLSRAQGQGFMRVPVDFAADEIVQGMADDGSRLWLGTSHGLRVADAGYDFRAVPIWPGGSASALTVSHAVPALWVAHWDGGTPNVLRHDAEGWTNLSVDVPAGEAPQPITVLVEDGSGQLWARSANDLWKLDPAQQRFEIVPTPIPLSALDQHGYLSRGRHGDLWVSTNDLLLHRDDTRWTERLGGPMLGTRPVLEDRDGSLWFGAHGLQRMAGRGMFHAYDVAEGMPGNVVWSIARDTAGGLWAGTERGLAHAVGERFETIAGTQDYTVRAIAAAPDGTLYFAGLPAADVLHYDPVKTSLKHLPLGLPNPPGKILELRIDHEGTLWATTDGAGLLRADTRAAEPHFVRETLPGAPGEFLRGLAEDSAGRLWVAGHDGLLMREHERWRRFTVADGLLLNEVRYVAPAHNGDLLVAYDGTHGFDRVRYEGATLRTLLHVDAGSTRYIDEIFIIGEDAHDNLWVGTGRGMDMYNASGVEHFGAQQGLLGEDTASMALLVDPGGDVWFGVVGGLMRFDAAKYAAVPHHIVPQTLMMEARLGDRSLDPTAGAVSVGHEQNTFQVRFTATSFICDGPTQYRTRLDGLETAAVIGESREARYPALPPGTYRFEVSARVGRHGSWGDPATFEFRVLPAWWQTLWARALVGLCLLLAGVLALRWRFAALNQRNRLLEERIAARTAELSETNHLLVSEIGERINAEAAVQQRNDELEDLNRKLAGTQSQLLQSEKMASVGQLAAGVAHEINNPIGFVRSNLCSLQGYVEEIFELLRVYELTEPLLPPQHPHIAALRALKQRVDLEFLRRDTDELLVETLDGVTRVQKIVKDLKDFSHVDEAEWQVIDLHQCLDSTLNVVAHELKYKADLVKEYGLLPRIRCLPFQINQVFLNLLVNAVHAIEQHGTITLRTGRDGEFVWVSISDTGKGIEAAILHRIFEPFFTTKPVGLGTGLGLSVSYGIVQKHGGTIEVASVPGKGTTFTLRLPIQRAGKESDGNAPRELAQAS